MITQKEYKKYPFNWWLGRKVITLRELQSRGIVIPEGTVMKITGKYQGFDLEGLEVCEHCKIGRKIYIKRVPPSDLRLLDVQQVEQSTLDIHA